MTPEQRRKFWAMVGDISRQVPLRLRDGSQVMADKESWRLVFCAGLTGDQRMAVGIHGEWVVIGTRLREIFKDLTDDEARRMATNLIELVQLFGDSHQVRWTDPEWQAMEAEHV